MKLKLGSFEITIEIENPSSSNVLELKLKEIINANNVTLHQQLDYRSEHPTEQEERVSLNKVSPQIHEAKPKGHKAELEALHAAGFTDKTIVMVATRVLGIKAVQADLNKDFGLYEKAAKQFLSRPIDEEIWAIFAAPLSLPGEDLKVAVLGLNKENQLLILAIKDTPPIKAFRDVISRGLDASKITLGVLSFHLGATEEFKEMFPYAAIQLDWQEYIDLSVGAEAKLKLKGAMISNEKADVKDVVKSIKAPRELLTFLDYPKGLHRAIRTTSAIKRIEKDVSQKLKRKGISPELKHFVLAWSLIRLQFHWFKVPVDSNQLTNLKYIKSQNEARVDD